MKYKGRKKYTPKEAGKIIENIMQLYTTNLECISHWRNNPSDKLIESLCKKTTKEMIKDNEKQNEYLMSKYDYMKKFNQNYKIKGSFGII